MLLQLAIARPALLPYVDQPFTLPHSNQVHPILNSLHLAGWTLSGNPSAKGFSDEEIRIIYASWSTGTDKQYNTVWKRWCGWCKERQADIIQASINDVVNFLADCFADGRSYNTINTYRSALSSTLCNINNVAVGSHPLVTRLLKGVYNLRTPSPRYSSTWDVTKVTGYLKTLYPLDQLSLKSLTLKTVMLCALSSALREQTLCALDITFLNKSGNSLSFSVSERLKTSRPGKSTRKVEFISLPEDNSLCRWLR